MRIKKILVILSFVILGAVKGYSQQYFVNGFYMFNPLSFNAGIVGTDDILTASAVYRNQWTNIEGAPETMTATIHGPVRGFFGTKTQSAYRGYPTGLSMGLTIVSDKLGATENIAVGIPVGVKIQIDKRGGRISLGVKPEIISTVTDLSDLVQDPGDPVSRETLSEMNIDFSTGLYLYYDEWYVGASVTNLREIETASEFGANLYRHYFISAGYAYVHSKDLVLRATTLATMVRDSPPTFTITPAVIIKDNVQFGVAYRYHDMFGVNFSMKPVKDVDLRIGYLYEKPIGIKTNQIGNTHEVVLSYSLKTFTKQIISPRYFW